MNTMFHQEDVINVSDLLHKAGVDKGMTVADLGVGRVGQWALTAAQMVSETGIVYAVDVVKDILEVIAQKAKAEGLNNLVPVWSDLEMYKATTRIADGALDVGILSTTLFQSSARAAMMKECVRMIKSDGRLIVVEWKPVQTAIGPPVEQRVHPEEVRSIARDLGLSCTEEFEAGEYHWGQLYRKE